MVARICAVVAIVVATAIVGFKFILPRIPIRVSSLETPPTVLVDSPTFKAGEYTLAGPYAHDNLSVYVIHGTDRLTGKHYVTLQQALQDKIVVVYETREVNTLQIENVSNDVDVYLQSGDIVKGGDQDRTIAMDFIVPPHSGRMSIDAFCVENGRWQQRGGEDANAFGSSINAVAGRDLKLAVKASANQGEVWQSVARNQDRLSYNTGLSVNDPQSASSLELTLENKKLQESTDAYAKALAGIVDNQNDAIGYVTAINGKISSADVYGSHELFMKLWPKLLNSASVEAFAELNRGQKFEPATSAAIKAAMADAEKGTASSKDVTARVQLVTRESKDNVVFETRDRQAAAGANTDRLDFNTGLNSRQADASVLALDVDGAWVHRSYINKEGVNPAAPAPDIQRQINGTTNLTLDVDEQK